MEKEKKIKLYILSSFILVCKFPVVCVHKCGLDATKSLQQAMKLDAKVFQF